MAAMTSRMGAPAAQAQQPGSLTNGLVAFYPFDGDARDASGNGSHGSPFLAGYGPDRHGRPSRSITFSNRLDGVIPWPEVAHVRLPTELINSASSKGTFAMWLFPHNGMGGLIGKAAPTVGSSPVFAYGGYSQNTGWSQAGDPGRIYFRPNNYSPLLASRALLSRSNWNHVVLTYSRTGVSLFLNGRLDSSLSGDFAIAVTEAPTPYNALGAYLWDNDGSRGAPNLYANGSFDDVRIYNRALSEAEVAALYAYESDLPIASGWGSNGLEVSDVREDVAISGDGSTVLMVGGQGNMFVSTDFATSWNDTGRQAYGRKVGLSHDGRIMLAPSHWGQLHVSHDGGLNWFTRGQGGPWQCAAVSADGSTMVAGNYYGGQMWVSRDRGESWSARGTAGDWMDVAVSINGQFMVSGRSSGPIQQSRDFGETWISGGPSGSCSAVAMTPDGRIQFAGIRGGKLYKSSDYGTNWTDLALVGDWTDAACSADGATVIFSSGTSATSGFLATSWDAGSTWITEEQGQYWETASISADGRKAVAAVYSGWIYTNTFLPSHDVVEPRPPEFTAQPVGVTTNLGGAVSLSVTAIQNVEGSMSYQWLKDNIPLPGATNPVLTVTNVQPPRIGDYQVVVGNAWGAVTSSVATLNIQGVDAGIWRGLVGYYPFREGARDESGFANHGTMMAGASLAPGRLGDGSSVRIDGINGLNKGVRITNSILNAGQPGYSVNLWFKTENGAKENQTLVNTDPHCGFAVSFNSDGSARLGKWMGDGDRWLSLANYSASQFSAPKWRMMTFIKDGSRFRLFADGSQESVLDMVTDGWDKPMSLWIGSIGPIYPGALRPGEVFAGLIDDVRIYNRALSDAEVAALYASEVPRPPQITAQPVGVTTNLGGTVSLSVTAIQNVEGTMSYQWLKDGIVLPGATNPVLTVTNVQPSSIGDYQVVVGNALGSVTSSVAKLNIQGIDAGIWRGLVGYYPFNGNANDESANGNDGGLHGATPSPDRFGKPNRAYGFSGNNASVITAEGNSLPTGSTPRTFSVWTKPDAKYPQIHFIPSTIFSYGDRNAGFEVYFNYEVVSNVMTLNANTYFPSSGSRWGAWIQDWDFSRWHHCVITIDGSAVLKVFVDGIPRQVSVPPQNSGFDIPKSPLRIGAPLSGPYDGLIDDVRIYNRALSDAEVAALYAIEVPPAVRMVVQPQDVTAVVGSYVSLTTVATNALGYQWFKDGSPVTGAIGWATQPSLVLPKITLADAGGYWVVASNMMGSVTSRVATLVVQAPPVVTSPPEDATASLAGTASFASAVTGVPKPTLQWIRDGLPIPGATHSTLTLSNVQPAWIGDYQLVASNAAGVVVSRVARLGIPGVDSGLWRGLVAHLPFSGTVSDEGSLGHRVVAHGGSLAPDRRGKANAAMNLGGVDEFIELPDHPAFAATNYSVALWFRPTRRASGSDGAVAAESLVSKGTLNWDLQLGTASEVSGGIRFRPSAGGVWEAAGSSYETNRWQHLVVVHDGSGKAVALYVDGVAMPLSASGTPGPVLATTQGLRFGLRFDGTQPFLGRIDDIRVYNRALSASEVKAMTSLEAAAPSVWAQPRDVRAVEGSRAVASVEVLGERPLGWEWTQAGLGVVGTRESLEFGALSRLDSGIYKVVVTNVFGAITSQPFAVDVLYRPEFVIEPTDKSVEAGVTVRLAAGVDGNPVPTLQWWKDGKALDGATNAALTLAAVQPGNAGRYQLVASNEVGTVTGREVTVRVAYAPVIGRQPTSVTVDHGRGFELFVEATGEPMPTFQWMLSGQAVAGATNAVYRVDSSTSADEGTYKVEVRNRLEVALSEPASVTVTRRLPVVLGLPDSTEVLEGGDMVLSASVQAIPGATLQWFHEGEVLPGEAHGSLTVLRMRGMEGGRYSLVATNVAGVTTNSVAVRVKASEWSLGEALDTGATLAWPWPTTLGWRRQVAESHDGEDAAQSGRIGGNQSSDLRLPLEGPGRLTFWWKTSCEDGWDYAELLLDGQRKGRLTGIRNWTAVGLDVPEGLHTVTWRYIKDGSKDAGADAAWVDEVSWTPEPGVKSMPWVEAVESGDGTLQVRVVGQPGGMSVEASPDLQGWTEAGRGVSKSGVLRWRMGKEEGARFYRGKVGGGN